jgi:hypothetical protein
MGSATEPPFSTSSLPRDSPQRKANRCAYIPTKGSGRMLHPSGCEFPDATELRSAPARNYRGTPVL